MKHLAALRSTRRIRRGFTLLELSATAALLGILTAVTVITFFTVTGNITTAAAKGNESAISQVEIQFAQSNQGLYTALPANLSAVPHNITVVNGIATQANVVSLSLDATTGNLGMASTNGNGTCTLAVLTPVSAGAVLASSTASTGIACDGASAVTNPQVNPSAPTIVSVTPASGAVTVTWTAPTLTGNGTITGYNVVSSPGSLTCTTSTTSCTVTGLTNNTTYTFVVTPETTTGPGTASAPSVGVTPGGTPTVPQNVSVVYPATGSISSSGTTTTTVLTTLYGSATVSWTAPASNGGSAVTSYFVQSYDQNGVAGPTCSIDASSTSCVVSNLAYGVQYSFTVYAANANGPGAVSAAVSMTGTTYGPPSAPSIDLANPPTPSSTTATIYWLTDTNTNGSNISLYTVTASPGGQTCTASSAATSCSISGLTLGTTYTFTVTATNAYGTSDPSDASPSITIVSAPGAPTSPKATTSVSSETTVSVSWSAPASNGGSPITSYNVTSSPGGFTCSTTSTSCTVSSLTKGTAYTFTVTATNAPGGISQTGPGATTASVTTPTNSLNVNQNLSASTSQAIYASNGAYKVIMQSDGNLVLYTSSGTALWSSVTTVSSGGSSYVLIMQGDCNLVLYTALNTPRTSKWSSNTSGLGSTCYATVSTTGHFQIYLGSTLIKTIH